MSNVNQTSNAATQYREVSRKANAGERIKIVNTVDLRYEIGEVFVVETSTSGGVYVKHPKGTNNGRMGIGHGAYVVLEPVAPAAPSNVNLPDLFAQFIRDNAGAVRSYLAELDPVDNSQPVADVNEPAPPQLTRAKVIEMARARVAELERIGRAHGEGLPRGKFHDEYYGLKFRINRERRTVVAEVMSRDGSFRKAKAYAKAAPDDVFNADIGKAIAAERALSLALTDAFVNAPKPEKAVPGVVIRKINGAHIGTTRVIERTILDGTRYEFTNGCNSEIRNCAIIDDTDASYGGEREAA